MQNEWRHMVEFPNLKIRLTYDGIYFLFVFYINSLLNVLYKCTFVSLILFEETSRSSACCVRKTENVMIGKV